MNITHTTLLPILHLGDGGVGVYGKVYPYLRLHRITEENRSIPISRPLSRPTASNASRCVYKSNATPVTNRPPGEDNDSNVVIRQILSFTLTEKVEFIREILIQEFSKI
ncbi:hypothetical protein L2E82_39314 [Cichorium intybus]|uniref:Uncharacterized protein n=1 Tax=Cichorium intybus TaxID=13427 RepID=A0ACB9AHU9_CICIN|nr:hypothetical protein L2E82_39314 [Cichorium intybus]